MTGSSVFDYVHQQDHAEVAEQLGLGLTSNSSSGPHSSSSGLASPSSAASEEHGSSSTANPDGKFPRRCVSRFSLKRPVSRSLNESRDDIIRGEIAKLINFSVVVKGSWNRSVNEIATNVCSLFERTFYRSI